MEVYLVEAKKVKRIRNQAVFLGKNNLQKPKQDLKKYWVKEKGQKQLDQVVEHHFNHKLNLNQDMSLAAITLQWCSIQWEWWLDLRLDMDCLERHIVLEVVDFGHFTF